MTGHHIVIYCILVSLVSTSNAALNSFLLNHYDLKISQSEATCRLVNHANLPEDRRTLAGRDCMCDADCVEYKDCCKDSRYYYPNQQSLPSPYHCSETSAVYLKAQCPPEWKDQYTAELCENSIKPLESDDTSLVLHISNQKTRITYGNAYCAACNYDQDMEAWMPWTMGVGCGEAPPGYLKKPIVIQEPDVRFPPEIISNEYDYQRPSYNYQQTYTKMDAITGSLYQGAPRFVLDINLYVYNDSFPGGFSPQIYSFPVKIETNIPQNSPNQYYTGARGKRQFNGDIDFEKYANVADKIAINAKYDSYNKKFVSKYNNKDFVCLFGSILPEGSEMFTRRCVPFLENSCPDSFKDETIKEESAIHTKVVYNKKTKKAYRNKDCARCNGEKEEATEGKPQDTRADLSGIPGGGGSEGASGKPKGGFVAAG